MKTRSKILITAVTTVFLFATTVTQAGTVGSDDFSYPDGTLGTVSPIWTQRGDTGVFSVSNGQVIPPPNFPGGGAATAYFTGHAHTNESVQIASIEMTIPSTSGAGNGLNFWSQMNFGLHQTVNTSGATFPATANSYMLSVRGHNDFNLLKLDGTIPLPVPLAGQPAPPNDPGGGGWTNFNGFDTTSTNHADPAGNLALDTTYILQIERNDFTKTVTGSITDKSSGTVVGEGSFVDPGMMHTGGSASLVMLGNNVGAFHADSYVMDNFQLADTPDGTFEWRTNGLGLWNASSNWTPLGGPPNSVNDSALFGDEVSAPTLVGVSDPVTVNRILFENTSHSYFVGGGGGVILAANSVSLDPSITVQGIHEFQTKVDLLNNTTVDVASGSHFEFNNRLFLNGNTLTKDGAGTLAISNDVVLGGGTVDVLQGTVSGNGTVGGDVINGGGTISPGGSNNAATVPEPATSSLLLLGLTLVFGCMRSSPF